MRAAKSKRLLVGFNTPSPHTQEMSKAVVGGATIPEIEGGDAYGDRATRCHRATG